MIYTITAFVFLILSLYTWDNKKKGNQILIYAVIWLIVFEGFRWEIGTDWNAYYDFFMYGNNAHMGKSYKLLNQIIRSFTDNFTVITLLLAFVTYTTLFLLLRKYSPNPIMSILIYYCSMIGLLGGNRQFIAMTICIGSLYFIFNRKQKLFWGTLTVAVTFHVTSLIFIPAYYLYNKKMSSNTIMILVLFAFIISLTKIINYIPFVDYLALMDSVSSGATSLQEYIDSYSGTVSIVGSLKRILFIYLALSVRNRVRAPYYDYFLYLYAVGTITYILFNGSVLQLMAGRGAAYYNVYECIVIPFVALKIPLPKSLRQMFWFFLFIIYFYLMWRDMNSYYIILREDIYNPYKSVLF